jgi:hypothetical protein
MCDPGAVFMQHETIYVGDKRVSIRTSLLEEKATAINMLCCYADELKEGFYPYVEKVIRMLWESGCCPCYHEDGWIAGWAAGKRIFTGTFSYYNMRMECELSMASHRELHCDGNGYGFKPISQHRLTFYTRHRVGELGEGPSWGNDSLR